MFQLITNTYLIYAKSLRTTLYTSTVSQKVNLKFNIAAILAILIRPESEGVRMLHYTHILPPGGPN